MKYHANHGKYFMQMFFMVNGKIALCVVDYHSTFPIVKKVNSVSADNLVQMTKLILAGYRLPKKIILDAGKNFLSETLNAFWKKMNIQQMIAIS